MTGWSTKFWYFIKKIELLNKILKIILYYFLIKDTFIILIKKAKSLSFSPPPTNNKDESRNWIGDLTLRPTPILLLPSLHNIVTKIDLKVN